jgi:hypothetical protein
LLKPVAENVVGTVIRRAATVAKAPFLVLEPRHAGRPVHRLGSLMVCLASSAIGCPAETTPGSRLTRVRIRER